MTPTLIQGARVFDLEGDVDRPPVTDILIEDGLISALGPEASARASALGDVERIDASDRLAIPGLVNAHYHSHDVMLRGLFEQLPLDIWSFYSFPANYTRRSNADVDLRTTIGAADCLANGITTVQDMVTIVGPDREHAEAVLSAYERSGIRAVLALQISDRAAVECVPFWEELPEATRGKLPPAGDPGELQRMIEALVAETDRPRLGWGVAPSAPQRCSEELMAWSAALAREHRIPVFTHLYEAQNQALLARQAWEGGSLLDYLERFGLLGPDLTIAHGVWISDEEVARFGAAGANLAFNAVSNMKLLNGFAPIRRYAEAGANIALGCDNCSGNDVQSVFQSMKMFALYWSMQSAAGEGEAARRAFSAATLGGARALGLDGKVGALRPGYRADVVLLDLDSPTYSPLNSALRQLVYAETGANIRRVLVDGRTVYRDGELATTPMAELKREAEAARARLVPEIEAISAQNADLLQPLLEAYHKAAAVPLPFDRYSMR